MGFWILFSKRKILSKVYGRIVCDIVIDKFFVGFEIVFGPKIVHKIFHEKRIPESNS